VKWLALTPAGREPGEKAYAVLAVLVIVRGSSSFARAAAAERENAGMAKEWAMNCLKVDGAALGACRAAVNARAQRGLAGAKCFAIQRPSDP